MINKRQKTQIQKTQKAQKTTKNAKAKTKNTKQKQKTNQVSSITKPEGGRKEKEKWKKGDGLLWCPVPMYGSGSAQFESCMKPGVRFMGLDAVPWIGW